MFPTLPRLAALSVAGLLALSTLATAADVPAAAAAAGKDLPTFEKLDANHDGVVTLPEIEVYPDEVVAHMKHCDANKDEKLTRAEYEGCKAPRAANGGR